MTNSCVAFGCTNRDGESSRNKGITFHAIPSNPAVRNAWLNALRRKDWDPEIGKLHNRVCSEHFLPNDFKTNNSTSLDNNVTPPTDRQGRRVLKSGAVPTVFPKFPSYLQPPQKKPRRVLCRNNVPEQEDSDDQPSDAPVPEGNSNATTTTSVPLDSDCDVLTHNYSYKNTDSDHNYAYPPDMDALVKHCNYLRTVLEKKDAQEKNVRRRLSRALSTKNEMKDVIKQLQENHLMTTEAAIHMERFDGVSLPPLQDLLGGKKVNAPYNPAHKEWSLTLYFLSPKAYEFLRKSFTLPAPSTLRKMVSSLHCLPGLQEEAFEELLHHRDDIHYKDAALMVDGMSIKELTEFDASLGKPFGYVDWGGFQDFGETEEKAKEAIVVMLVGYRKFWKLPLGYFLVKGTPGVLIAGMIRECLLKTYEIGVKVWTVTMDGTQHNISAFSALGATVLPAQLEQMKTSFKHPHPDANYEVSAILDPPHMMKLVRSTLGDYIVLVWPGHGKIRWSYISQMHTLQEEHGLRLANKLTQKHVFYQKNKMKVKIALQTIASNSLAKAFRWAHENKVAGFEDTDVLVTAEFLEINDQLFDILNSKSPRGLLYKAALSSNNVASAEIVFKKAIDMYGSLEDTAGIKLIHSKRRCGPLGLLADIQSVRTLFTHMSMGNLDMNYLPCYKFSQDHLELFFNAIRSRNGWSYNPTSRQFRTAFRQLLYHAGKHILGSIAANCIAQDETAILTLGDRASKCPLSQPPPSSDNGANEVDINNNVPETQILPSHKCKVQACKICSAAISYIAGFYCFSLKKRLNCFTCKSSLCHSDEDKCPNRSLILMKNYYGENEEKGLSYPSGSLCFLLYDAEEFFRQCKVNSNTNIEKMISDFLLNLSPNLFPTLSVSHGFTTAYGTDNHYTSMIHLILKKYFALRVKKVLKDLSLSKKVSGNAMHRARIFSNV